MPVPTTPRPCRCVRQARRSIAAAHDPPRAFALATLVLAMLALAAPANAASADAASVRAAAVGSGRADAVSIRAAAVGSAPAGAAPAPPQGPASCLPLTTRNADGNYIVPGVRGAIVYRRIGIGGGSVVGGGSGSNPSSSSSSGAGASATATATELSLDAYVQPGGGGPRPGVVVLHGGGWERGSRAAFTGQFLELLTRAGYNWVAIDYRLGPLVDHDRAVDDVQAALAFVRCHARELRIDPARLVLWGEDTGAQLAALVASRPSSGVKAMVLVGGIYDLHATGSIPRGSPTDLVLRASPLHRVRSRGMPSTLIVHGTEDGETPLGQARRYCTELRAVRAACEIIEVDGASHRAENWWPSQWGYKPRVVDWLSRTLSFTAPPPTAVPITAVTGPGLHKDIVFSPTHGLKLDAYIPTVQGDRPGPFPAVIIAHGGGWEAGDKVTYVTPLFEPLAKAGFAWFSIDYRLTPDVLHPAQLDDLREAIRFVRANASRFNIDLTRIALLGESASGQMVMQVAATNAMNAANAADTAVAAVVSFYGVYDFEALVESSPAPPQRTLYRRLFGLPTLDASAHAALRAHSPIHHVHRGMPPVLLIHGTNERLWPQGQSMSRILTERGIPHELLPLEGAPHGLENWEGHAPWQHYKPRLIIWLRANLRSNTPDRE